MSPCHEACCSSLCVCHLAATGNWPFTSVCTTTACLACHPRHKHLAIYHFEQASIYTSAWPWPTSLTSGLRENFDSFGLFMPNLTSKPQRLSRSTVVCLQAQAHSPVQDLSWVSLQLNALGQECVTRMQQAGALPGSLQVRGEAFACIHTPMSCKHILFSCSKCLPWR